ncbi:hypothetical protein NI17_005895 [Thermobifida halotolerans]|uniref:Uncharacterized protein n=1 Tax=Thermobifida halotolerans TaxID=483545 RepID=A0A399G500_9ACTN|nr:hypothetical protein [Thermobifida halotolerans]UOE20731.1 hypothetical protein NI17_005895 [Thermobifida halotolerans]
MSLRNGARCGRATFRDCSERSPPSPRLDAVRVLVATAVPALAEEHSSRDRFDATAEAGDPGDAAGGDGGASVRAPGFCHPADEEVRW